MNGSIYKLAAFFLLTSTCLFAATDVQNAPASSSSTFPATVTFNADGKDYHLQFTGEATRKKFFVSVYTIGHYIQSDAKASGDKFQSVLSDDKAKQLTLIWQRAIDGPKIQEGFVDSFKKTLTTQEYDKQKGDIDKFNQFFSQGVQKNDKTEIRWLPDGKISVLHNGKDSGSITSKEFAKSLWSIWFGSNSVVDRNKLVSDWK